MSSGILAQFQALTDLKTLLDTTGNWTGITTKPTVDIVTNNRVLNWVENDAYVLIQVDDEIMKIFSHWQTGQVNAWDDYVYWHRMPITIEVHTKADTNDTTRFAEVCNRVTRILKANVRLSGYIELLILKATPNNEDRLYRSMSIDCELNLISP